ncbi:armadillo-type protein [Jackrogersella minutella]|nr:armadillo-type protein [Jackrogersella minutella]
MASVNDYHLTANIAPNAERSIHHQRSKSNLLKSLIHKRNNSDGSVLPSTDLLGTSNLDSDLHYSPIQQDISAFPNFSRPAALGEIQQNQIGISSRSPTKGTPSAPASPTKTGFNTFSARKLNEAKEQTKLDKQSEPKPKKTKSATNLMGLLSRPKSSKNLQKQAEDELRSKKNKENQPPQVVLSRPPIYAQFSSGAVEKQNEFDQDKNQTPQKHGVTKNPISNSPSGTGSSSKAAKPRPKSYHAPNMQSADTKLGGSSSKTSMSKIQRGLKAFTSGAGSQDRPISAQSAEPVIDPKNIDKQLEAMLDRRNIPEHQRYKMRSLADTIKLEFIRQDWAESRGINGIRPESHGSDSSINVAQAQQENSGKPKKSRGRSFTLSRGKKSESVSPVKKQKGESSIGRHFRSRSTESVASERPSSAGSSSGKGILSKVKSHQGPQDFVTYLRKVQKPELMEVGKMHKLRLLLRNETVAWTEEFIRQGGMQEIVGLLHRIMEIEWREEHEDTLLHETLLCLKALCTIALALQYLHSIQGTLFPALLHMIFDPERKGPSEFTTRNIITSVLFTYIQSAPPADRSIRAKSVLGHLRDPEPNEEDRPVGFVLDMRRERPYRVWCKEAVHVCKEIFWIFLHNVNVVHLPREKEPKEGALPSGMNSTTYMETYFPREKPPVPAAPYVGGVEWDATNYLTSHLDLMNAIIACTPTAEARNTLRSHLHISGWERCMGGTMRLCKEKLYPGMHDALRTWVAAAAEDGWDVRDVRYGPPAAPKTPRKNGGSPNKGKSKVEEPPPRIDMPQFNLGPDPSLSPGAAAPAGRTSENWLL